MAAECGVDSALVMHYFGSKEGLFRAAIEWPFDIDDIIHRCLDGDMDGAGERLVRTMCEIWEGSETRHPLNVILRNVAQHDEAGRLIREFIQREMIGRLVARSDDPHADLRGGLVHSAIVGLFISRYVVRVEPLASAPREVVVKAVGAAIQRYLTGDVGADDPG